MRVNQLVLVLSDQRQIDFFAFKDILNNGKTSSNLLLILVSFRLNFMQDVGEGQGEGMLLG